MLEGFPLRFLSCIFAIVNDQTGQGTKAPVGVVKVFSEIPRNRFRFGREFSYNEKVGDVPTGRGVDRFSKKESER
jgi:hypothetical protein